MNPLHVGKNWPLRVNNKTDSDGVSNNAVNAAAGVGAVVALGPISTSHSGTMFDLVNDSFFLLRPCVNQDPGDMAAHPSAWT